jgi:hypothetical protein
MPSAKLNITPLSWNGLMKCENEAAIWWQPHPGKLAS